MLTSNASLTWWDSPSPVSRENWTSTQKNSWSSMIFSRTESASSSATGGSKTLKKDPSPASLMLRTAEFEKLAGQRCLFSWVIQQEALPQVLSSQKNQVLCTTEVVYQMTSCTVPAKSRKVTFNAFLKNKKTPNHNKTLKGGLEEYDPLNWEIKKKFPEDFFFLSCWTPMHSVWMVLKLRHTHLWSSS